MRRSETELKGMRRNEKERAARPRSPSARRRLPLAPRPRGAGGDAAQRAGGQKRLERREEEGVGKPTGVVGSRGPWVWLRSEGPTRSPLAPAAIRPGAQDGGVMRPRQCPPRARHHGEARREEGAWPARRGCGQGGLPQGPGGGGVA